MSNSLDPSLLEMAAERTKAWRTRHDAEQIVTGSADGWLVLDTLDALIARIEDLAAQVKFWEERYRFEVIASGESEARKLAAQKSERMLRLQLADCESKRE